LELLRGIGLAKRYDGVRALEGVNFSVCEGEVHALVGENGAGKSTLTKILAGIVQPDQGEIRWRGQPVSFDRPASATQRGIHTVHQELELALPLSVAENVFLGNLPGKGRIGLVDRRLLREKTENALRQLGGGDIDPDRAVHTLPIADRQVVEIARALVHGDLRLLILDEPTAALPPLEAGRVLSRVRGLRDAGVGIIYISHRLDEVIGIADRISVLRDGQKIIEMQGSTSDRASLITHILGRELGELNLEKAKPHDARARMLECRALSAPPDLEDLTFDVGRGEIVGFFGLLGSGQSLVAQALFGLHPVDRADCEIAGHAGLPRFPAEAIAWGIGYVPADRKGEGLATRLSIEENILMAALERVTRVGIIDRPHAREIATEISSRYDVRCRSLDQAVRELSGGNQQKVALGKWAATRGTQLLLLDEPTRGVDVGAKAEIYRLLRQFADNGGSCVVCSSDVEEVRTVADRAYVMRRGKIATELSNASLNETALIGAAL
jgi:ABC-type sugar transport system ATPase subunit